MKLPPIKKHFSQKIPGSFTLTLVVLVLFIAYQTFEIARLKSTAPEQKSEYAKSTKKEFGDAESTKQISYFFDEVLPQYPTLQERMTDKLQINTVFMSNGDAVVTTTTNELYYLDGTSAHQLEFGSDDCSNQPPTVKKAVFLGKDSNRRLLLESDCFTSPRISLFDLKTKRPITIEYPQNLPEPIMYEPGSIWYITGTIDDKQMSTLKKTDELVTISFDQFTYGLLNTTTGVFEDVLI